MEQKFTKPVPITTLVFAFISMAHITNLKGIEDVKAIYIVSLLPMLAQVRSLDVAVGVLVPAVSRKHHYIL
jgi:hypothetical protein